MNLTPYVTGYLPPPLYNRFRSAFVNILTSHICLHFRIIRLHLAFYFANLSRPPGKMGYIQQLWIRTYYALTKAISKGHLVAHHLDKHWLYLPKTDSSTVETAFNRNSSTYRMWTDPDRNHTIGSHSHRLIRRMLRFNGFRQPKNPPTFYLESGQEINPDAFTLTPISAAFEVKNGTSDVWTDPRTIAEDLRSNDYEQIFNHFQMCKEHQLHPAFVGVKFDPTFYDFAKDNNGLVFELGFQIFPPHLQTLKNAIAADLGFRNIIVVSENPPYPPEFDPFFQWLDNIKQLSRTP